MTTASDLIARTKQHLLGMQREAMDVLVSGITSSQTSFQVTYDVSQIQQGSYVAIGLELMYVWAVEQGSKTVTVQRGQLGSTAATHATGDVITVNPRFPDFMILQEINADLDDLCSPVNGLFAMRSIDLTGIYGQRGYDLAGASSVLEVQEVRYRVGAAGGRRDWIPLTDYDLDREVNTADFPSGVALFLPMVGTSAVRVRYKATFTHLTNLTDDVETVAGLPLSAHDLPPLGAAIRLVAGREIKRNFTESQGDSKRATEVGPGAVNASSGGLRVQRAQRITAEAARLEQQYPTRGWIPEGGPTTVPSNAWYWQ